MLKRKEQAVKKLCDVFGMSYLKLGPLECDFKLLSDASVPIGYAQVVEVDGMIRYSYPLSISIQELSLLKSKVMNPIIIWACDDGILYTKIKDTYGTFRWYNNDLHLFFTKQKNIKFIKYV